MVVAGALFSLEADWTISEFVNTDVVCYVIEGLLVPHNKTGCKAVSMKTGQKEVSYEQTEKTYPHHHY